MTWCCEHMAYGRGEPCELCKGFAAELRALEPKNPLRIGTTHPLGNRAARRQAQAQNRAARRDRERRDRFGAA